MAGTIPKYIRTVFLTSDMLAGMRFWVLRGLLLTAVAGLTIAQTSSGPITFERIQNSNREPQNWLTYSGNNLGQRYSLLTQITVQNAKKP